MMPDEIERDVEQVTGNQAREEGRARKDRHYDQDAH